jgi:hypothetical protein
MDKVGAAIDSTNRQPWAFFSMPGQHRSVTELADEAKVTTEFSQVAAPEADTPAMASENSRWYGVGHSVAPDATVAGTEAVVAALAGRDAALVLVFCSVGYDLTALLEAVRANVGAGTAIAGCSTLGQVALPVPSNDGVFVAALGGTGFQVSTRVGRDASQRRREAGGDAAECIADISLPNQVVMLLVDGVAGQQHEIVRGAYSVVGADVPLVGGCAGDELTYSRTYQFHGTGEAVEVLSDAVVGIALGSEAALGIGIAHGWRKRGDAMIVTSSSEGHLYQLDNEPALDVYLRRVGGTYADLDDPDAFRKSAFKRPLGLSRRSGEDIRVLHGGDVTDGSLTCLADVPQGALAWLMESDDESLLDGAVDSCTQAVEELGGVEPIGVLIFDCGARKVMLGPDGTPLETAAISKIVGDVPFGGFYTYGEVARTRGARGMHHLTFVSLAFA